MGLGVRTVLGCNFGSSLGNPNNVVKPSPISIPIALQIP